VPRWPCRVVLLGATLALVAVAAVFAMLPGRTVFLATAIVFGLLWAFASPYFTRLLIDVDPSHRAALLGSAALLLGCATGPTVAALTVSDADIRGCLSLGTGLLTVAGGIVLLIPVLRRVAQARFTMQQEDRS
jgi:MFS family permease